VEEERSAVDSKTEVWTPHLYSSGLAQRRDANLKRRYRFAHRSNPFLLPGAVNLSPDFKFSNRAAFNKILMISWRSSQGRNLCHWLVMSSHYLRLNRCDRCVLDACDSQN
jgi:hypothetical protein